MRQKSERRGVASVIGTMLFIVVLMAGLGAIAYVYSLQAQSSQAAQQAQQLLNQKGKESLTYEALSGGTLAVANTGSSGSTIRYVILKFANGTVYQFSPNLGVNAGNLLPVPSLIPSQSCGLSTCLSKYDTILASTNPGNSIGLVTSLGNVFWLRPASSVQAGDPSTTYQVAFGASGDSAFGSSSVVVIDGTGYAASQLPVTLTWFAGTQHSYAFQSLQQGTGTQVGISSVSGLETTVSGTITATSTGTVMSTYTTQYLLTVNGGNGIAFGGSPGGGAGNCNGSTGCWYNSGSTAQVTANNVWSVVSGQSRQNLASWNLDGSSNTNIARSDSGTWTTAPVTMASPQTLNLNAVTQYYVTAAASVPASGSVGALSVNYNYIGPSTNPQAAANPSFSGGVLSPWTPTTSCSECGTVPGCNGGDQVTASTGETFLEAVAYCSTTPGYEANALAEIQQTLQNPPSGVTFTSMTFSMSVSMYNYYVYGPAADALVCLWITGGGASCTTTSGTVTATWSGSTTAVPTIFAEAVASAMYYNGLDGVAYSEAYVAGASWSVTYTGPISGTASSASNTFSVSGSTATYSYGVGYSYPSGSTSMSWSASWPATETYSSNTCSGVASTSNPIAASPASSSAACTLTTARSGSYAITLASPTGDGWFDSGVGVSLSTSPTGPFSFSSWSASSGGLLIGSATSASTTVTVNTYGTILANLNVNP